MFTYYISQVNQLRFWQHRCQGIHGNAKTKQHSRW